MPGVFAPSWQGERALGSVRHRSERKKLSAEQATFSALTGGGSLARGQEQHHSGRVPFQEKTQTPEGGTRIPSRRRCLGVGPVRSQWRDDSQQTVPRVLCHPPRAGRGAVGKAGPALIRAGVLQPAAPRGARARGRGTGQSCGVQQAVVAE